MELRCPECRKVLVKHCTSTACDWYYCAFCDLYGYPGKNFVPALQPRRKGKY